MRDNNKEKHYIIRMDKGYGIEEYTRVYRYVGGSLNEK